MLLSQAASYLSVSYQKKERKYQLGQHLTLKKENKPLHDMYTNRVIQKNLND